MRDGPSSAVDGAGFPPISANCTMYWMAGRNPADPVAGGVARARDYRAGGRDRGATSPRQAAAAVIESIFLHTPRSSRWSTG